MSYTVKNFKTKKALKEAVDNYMMPKPMHDPVKCYNPVMGPDLSHFTGTVCLEGPHYPEAHKWWVTAELVNGVVVKVK